MSNDMPDVIYITEMDISHPQGIVYRYWTDIPRIYPHKYYSESHIQQLIKKAEQRQRERVMPMYRKKQLQELFPWEPSMVMDIVSVSEADRLNGSPKEGDMIAFNPKDKSDMWLVAKEFFEENYEEV